MEVRYHGNLLRSHDYSPTESAKSVWEEHADKWPSLQRLVETSSKTRKQGHQIVGETHIVHSSPHSQDSEEKLMEPSTENKGFGTKSTGLKLMNPNDSSSFVAISSNGDATHTTITQDNPTVNGISGTTPPTTLDTTALNTPMRGAASPVATVSGQPPSTNADTHVQAESTTASPANSAPIATSAPPDSDEGIHHRGKTLSLTRCGSLG